MMTMRAPRRRVREEAEKPFWISFSDLMTALMVLFLVVMGVALLAVTKEAGERAQQDTRHRADIDLILDRLSQAAARYEGVKVDRERRVIDFGDRARFGFNRSTLTPDQEALLRRFVPEVLDLANDGLGSRLIKRIVVEGHADRTGTYLGNLDLSLQRSQRVLCALLAARAADPLTPAQKASVRELFMVGGYASNAAKASDEASRRVELRLEFSGVAEDRALPAAALEDVGECALR
ncbi:MAG: OmpA family protein [Pseudomonadota bacterium]|nr:OmpA family protein [Pseudomonadota bacterium]